MTHPDVSNAPVRRPSDYGQAGMQGTHFQPGMNRQNPPGGSGGAATSSVQVVITGPLFDGMAQAAIGAMVEDIQYVLGSQGLANVHQFLDQSIQHPTPYYETQITVQRQANDVVVHDRGIAYGPWLEGVSERNRATSFKGYHAFRRATEELRRQAPALVGHVVQQHLGAMG